MARPTVKFVCANCGAQYSSWQGRCVQCGEWNTIAEEVQLVTGQTAGTGLNKKAGMGRALKVQAVSAAAGRYIRLHSRKPRREVVDERSRISQR